MNTIPQQLKEILSSSGWSQEQLAQRLGVSFKTLNSWVNQKAVPRAKATESIQQVYIEIVGSDTISSLAGDTKLVAEKKKLTVKELIKNQTLLDTVTLYLTYHTNTIEGSTMTLQDVEDVLFDNKVLSNRTTTEQVEARNHKAALYFLLDELHDKGQDFQWSKELILATHLRLLNGILDDAGQFRRHGVRVMGSHAPRPNYIKISDLIDEFCKSINAPTSDLINDLAIAHATFEHIHPFSDGNGRSGRLIMFIHALSQGSMPPLIIKERKRAYYRYLEIAHLENRYDLLAFFIAQSVLFTDDLIQSDSSQRKDTHL